MVKESAKAGECPAASLPYGGITRIRFGGFVSSVFLMESRNP